MDLYKVDIERKEQARAVLAECANRSDLEILSNYEIKGKILRPILNTSKRDCDVVILIKQFLFIIILQFSNALLFTKHIIRK